MATIDYYATSAKGSGCERGDRRSRSRRSARLTAFGEKLAPYDMELRLEQVRDDAEAYAAGPRRPRRPAPPECPAKKDKKKQKKKKKPKPPPLADPAASRTP